MFQVLMLTAPSHQAGPSYLGGPSQGDREPQDLTAAQQPLEGFLHYGGHRGKEACSRSSAR